ncbi:MAG: ABC transporter ATP-binding protein [Planctomycetota bacterium]|jgi:ABC-2 type transport system ATP-binding protein
MNPLVKLEHITKDYGRLRALDDVSVSIGPGVTGLLGPNGAGKTTLIKVLLALVRMTGGSGSVLGHALGRQTRSIRAQIGYMPEDDCYLAGFSGVETVRFAARLSGLPSIEALRRAHEILDFCGMEQERYRNVETYSTGMRQKVKFAQAIVHDPPLLILDEPTAGLDPEEREAMLHRVTVLAGEMGKAVVLSTHILPDVQATCQSVIILAKGMVRLTGQLDVLSRPAAPSLEVRPFGDAEPLADRIRQEGYEVEQDSDGVLTVNGADESVLRGIWTWAHEVDVGIRTLIPARTSLEQIFLEAVREDDHAHS